MNDSKICLYCVHWVKSNNTPTYTDDFVNDGYCPILEHYTFYDWDCGAFKHFEEEE